MKEICVDLEAVVGLAIKCFLACVIYKKASVIMYKLYLQDLMDI
jgi:hypothetical protein